MHGLGNLVFIALVPAEMTGAIEDALVWEHRDSLIYNQQGKLREPQTALRFVHLGQVPSNW